jgi:type I restriction enzyme R subunit
MKRISEAAFEAAVEWVLPGDGLVRVQAQGFDHEGALYCDKALAYTRAMQAKGWEMLEAMLP